MDVFYIGPSNDLKPRTLYWLRSLVYTPYGPMGRVYSHSGKVLAVVPLCDLVDAQECENCPQCGGRGNIEWVATIPVQNPEDPYGEPLPFPEQVIETCNMCGGIGRLVENPTIIHET